MTLSFSSLSGGTSFTVITSTGGSKTATLSKTFPAGTYLIESMAADTNLEIYLGASDGTQVGSCVAGAKSVTASASFLYVTTVNADTNDAVTFTLKSAATLATKTDATWAPPTITDITPSGLPNVDDTTTITGTNFASNVEVKFRKSDNSTLVTPKTTVRGSATSIIAGRPDSFAVGDAPYDVIVTNPSTTLSATSLNAITSGAVPVWVTSSTLNAATIGTSFSQTIQATDADGSSTITYAIVSGEFQAGLSFNTSTGAITGTPTGSSGTSTIVISATDSGSNAVNRTFTQVINAALVSAETLIIGGGGAGGSDGTQPFGSGGGGAGGFRSPSFNFSTGISYTVTVGGGGTGATSANRVGGTASSISGTGITTITSAGGGGGGYYSGNPGGDGGSGGGGSAGGGGGGSGNTPSTSPSQGNNGAAGAQGGLNTFGGGGGGAGTAATDRNGGNGYSSSITGTSITYAGGGGGGNYPSGPEGTGGSGGGGAAGAWPTGGTSGTVNTGSGGGAQRGNSSSSNPSGSGGSGVVIIRTTSPANSTTGSPVSTTPVISSTQYYVYKFNNTGSITF